MYKISHDLTQTQAQSLTIRLSGKILQCLELLKLPLAELNEYVNSVIVDNPLLDMNSSIILTETPPSAEHNDRTSFYSSHKHTFFEKESDTDFLQYNGTLGTFENTYEELKLNLYFTDLTPYEINIGHYIIDNLDNHGFFTLNMNELCSEFNVPEPEAENILKTIQHLAGNGIGARNISECLILQIPDSNKDKPLIQKLLVSHLDDLAHGNYHKCSKALKISTNHILTCMDYIRTLNPYPPINFVSGEKTAYVLPDIIIHRTEQGFSYTISGNPENIVRFDQDYISFIQNQTLSKEENSYLHNKYSDAILLKKSMNLRYENMKKLTLLLLKKQTDFFHYGTPYLHPLTMQEAANSLGLNVSTVSRMVTGKYIQTPCGIYPLKNLFVTSLPSDTGDISSEQIRHQIRLLIKKEDPHRPYSDTDISCILEKSGISIARRTVAKYLTDMKIGNQQQRKRGY